MFSLAKKRDQRGFTIVELLIVIVVIGILAALVVTTYGGIQAKGRDSQRQSDLQALQTQVEAFYANKNYYPTAANLSDSDWRKDNMKSLDEAALQDPQGADSNLDTTAASSGNQKVYGYVATGCATVDSVEQCTGYTLSAYLETEKKAVTKSALDG